VSLGYRIEPEQRGLLIIPEEAEVVRTIFDLYLQTHSIGFRRARVANDPRVAFAKSDGTWSLVVLEQRLPIAAQRRNQHATEEVDGPLGGHLRAAAGRRLPTLMRELVEWLRDEQAIHPVLVAGIAQFQLVHIHPFVDGNGRTSRLLSTLCL